MRLATSKPGGVGTGPRIGLGTAIAVVCCWGAAGPAAAGEAVAAPAAATLADAEADPTAWSDQAPPEAMLPFYDIDWSLGLRGAYTHDNINGDRYKALVLPSVTLTHTGDRLSFHGAADAQLSKAAEDGPVNVDQARLSAGTALQFNPEASLVTDGSVSMSKEDPRAPDVGADVLDTPTTYSGSADATFKQKLGRFNVSLSGTGGRDIYGPTTLVGNVAQDNSSQDNTHFGGGLRLGFQLSPVIELFTEGDVTRTIYDQPVASLSTKLDGNLYTAMGGIAANWDDRLLASASAGVGLQHFDDPTLGEVAATLYDASLTYKPDDTLSLTGDLSTTIGSPGVNGTGTAKVDYAATAGAAYIVNDWLTWRGSAGWHDARYTASTDTDTGYSFGVGADYLVSRHAKLSADYAFEHSAVTPNPVEDTHTVTLGLTLQK